MKEYELKKVTEEKIILKSVKCDRCNSECKNTYFNIISQFGCDGHKERIEIVCFKCWEKIYQKKIWMTRQNWMKPFQKAIKRSMKEATKP